MMSASICWRFLRKRPLVIFICALIGFLLFLSQSPSIFGPPLKSPRPLTDYTGDGFLKEFIPAISCQKWLLGVGKLPVPALLIDVHVLQWIADGNCKNFSVNMSVKIGVNVNLKPKFNAFDQIFDVFYYSNDTSTDYLDFHTQPRKIIPQNFPNIQIGNLLVPTVIPQFLEFWRRAKFQSCRNVSMSERDSLSMVYWKFKILQRFQLTAPKIPSKESVEHLAVLRDEMLQFGIYPFLNGGTFLGWYRECTVIPHTTDMDLAVFSENWNPEFLEFLWSRQSKFRVKRQFGMVNDSFEITVLPKTRFQTLVDVFLLYNEGNKTDGTEYRWAGGTGPDGSKYKYIYPPYDPWCSADLLGHIFWVTCTPEAKVTLEYGPNWHLDQNSLNYAWNAARNSVPNGRFTEKQMKNEVYNIYRL
ncbi:W02B3.4-like N-terminal domain-containing protein [Caenorhabditis elegans]|uniref:Fukutin n=1 Tax=Caenorhabditis elegans TaxID=6239 RepID=A0A679L8Q3_CAEEL|nr:Fukutin [Caenorhabditis elegans]NP_001366816.1 Fukutin [Caenorhabditis elegans]CAA9991444.1 Fukutin [Caenorhabditis elegans]CAA9991445.1 Fukutin [Caenorhabditis elegans]